MAKKYTLLKLIFWIVLLLTIYPITVGSFALNTLSPPFSIFNTRNDGLSKFAGLLNENGYRVQVISSSLKILRSVNETSLLIIIAPSLRYDIQEAIALIDYMMRGGSVLIVDDFYAANSLLENMWMMMRFAANFVGENANFGGLYFNTSAVLMDVGSYEKNPANVIVRRFNDYYGILSDVDSVITSFPSIITIKLYIKTDERKIREIVAPLPSQVGFMISTGYSWLETNLSSALRGEAAPDPWEWGGVSFSLGFIIDLPFGSRFAMISDPDIFSNKLISLKEHDNAKFAISLIKWLVKDSPNALILFDEAHLPHPIYDPLLGLSMWFRLLSEASSSWILAPIMPLLIIFILIGYIPRLSKFKPRLLSRVERVTERSWLRARIRWYKQARNYRYAASVLIDYLIQSVVAKYGLKSGEWEDVLGELLERHADLLSHKQKIMELMYKLQEISLGKKKISDKQFVEIVDKYLEIKQMLLG